VTYTVARDCSQRLPTPLARCLVAAGGLEHGMPAENAGNIFTRTIWTQWFTLLTGQCSVDELSHRVALLVRPGEAVCLLHGAPAASLTPYRSLPRVCMRAFATRLRFLPDLSWRIPSAVLPSAEKGRVSVPHTRWLKST
jgi:hypothetical protein